MAHPRPAVPKPTPAEFFKLTNSLHVKIYVGNQLEPYVMPKDLLTNYSPYFRAAFNGNLKKGIEGVLRLPDEEPAMVKILIEYRRSGTARSATLFRDGIRHYQVLDHCFEFIVFCDKYDLCEAASVIAEPYGKALDARDTHLLKKGTPSATMQEEFEFILNRLNEGNPAHKVVTRFLAKTLCSSVSDDREAVEQSLMEEREATVHAMRAFVVLTAHTGEKSRTLIENDKDVASYERED